MTIGSWKDLTIKTLFPKLGETVKEADQVIDNLSSDLGAKVTYLNQTVDTVNLAYLAANNALSSIKDMMAAITDTGVHAVEFNGVGKYEVMDNLEVALDAPDAPVLNKSTYAGGILLLVTGVTTEDMQSKLDALKEIMNGL